MLMKVTQITLVVNNKEAALEFYTKKVGFEKKTDYTSPEGYRYVTVAPKDQDLELILWQVGDTDPTDRSASWKPASSGTIFLLVEDCKKSFAELKARGVEFKQPKPDEYPWGIQATFADPDGNLYTMRQPPAKSW